MIACRLWSCTTPPISTEQRRKTKILKRYTLVATAAMMVAILVSWVSISVYRQMFSFPVENATTQELPNVGIETSKQTKVLTTSAESISKYAQLSSSVQRAIWDITKIVESSKCTEDSQCVSVAIGHKACGGPNNHAVYSSTLPQRKIDTLIELAKKTVDLEKQMNGLTHALSTCGITSPPRELTCSSMHCVSNNAQESRWLIQWGQKEPYITY